MAGVLDSVRDCAQNHPVSVAAGLIITLPGAYFYITGKSITCAVGLSCADTTAPSSSPSTGMTTGLSVYGSQSPLDVRLNFPTSRWTDKPASTFMFQVFQGTIENVTLLLTSAGERLGIDVRRILEERWAPHFSITRLVSVAITTALPGAFLVFIRDHPNSWAARHQTKIANALHVFALVTVANQRLSMQDLLVATLVMVSFEALQRTLNRAPVNEPPAVETPLSQTHAIVAKSDTRASPKRRRRMDKDSKGEDDSSVMIAGSKDEEIMRLYEALTTAKSSEKAKEYELKRAQKELKSARDTLNETFAEYSSLRDELKTMKQTLGRDHQAIIYRKDIELFALRKGNEQKESYIKEREAKLEDIYRQQKTTLELKDAEIRNLNNRLAFLEQQQSPGPNSDFKVDSAVGSDTQDAVQVRLLRVKGRSSSEIQAAIEQKETEIATLKIDLAKALSACEALEKTQDELRRAWDSVFEVQNMLNEERQRHAQTQNKLQEAANRLEEDSKSRSMKSLLTALPTIEEDKHELEAMFNAAQEDNLRLYTEVEALEKRVREANAKVFISEQKAEALTEQLRLEKAINEEMETARPSLVHRVHFQRMEGQLKESRDQLAEKDDEIAALKESVGEKDGRFVQLEKDKDTAAALQTKLQEENEQLKRSVADLEVTKQQLMLDHERLAQHRARQRNSSAEHTSARSSATLFTDTQNQAITSEEPLPARPVSIAPTPTHTPSTSIQGTPERHLRSDTQKLSMISNEVPPPELRGVRRKSLTLKGLMKKFARKDDAEDKTGKDNKSVKEEETEKERPKKALMSKDRDVLMRPKAAPTPSPAPIPALPVGKIDIKANESAATKELKQVMRKDAEKMDTPASRPKVTRTTTPRYYATHPDGRPMTAAPTTGEPKSKEGNEKTKEEAMRPMTAAPSTTASRSTTNVAESKEEADAGKARPKSRGWAASRKLVRRSIA